MGRQEDAHEYLIALLDAMHERSIAGLIPKPPPDIECTSFIYRIFGGRIRSQVKCTQCGYESNTYDPFLDLSLEINHASSLEKALHRFTAGETLDGANKYKCPKENVGVRAIKRITIETAPSVLVVQLKRFEFSLSGRKISRQVEFQPTLDLSPYMSHKPKQPEKYDLYGVLVHQGHSMHSGHYYCYIKGSVGGDWHKFDDTRVNLTAERNVLGQHAYILFYIKRPQPTPVVAGRKGKSMKENSTVVGATKAATTAKPLSKPPVASQRAIVDNQPLSKKRKPDEQEQDRKPLEPISNKRKAIAASVQVIGKGKRKEEEAEGSDDHSDDDDDTQKQQQKRRKIANVSSDHQSNKGDAAKANGPTTGPRRHPHLQRYVDVCCIHAL